MRGSPRMSDVELVAREQRRETPTTIRQYVSFEWRGAKCIGKKICVDRGRTKSNGIRLVETVRRVEIEAGLSA